MVDDVLVAKRHRKAVYHEDEACPSVLVSHRAKRVSRQAAEAAHLRRCKKC